MYRDKLLYGLMATAALFAGCSDDFSDISNAPKNPVAEGDEILFGAANLNTFDEGFTDGTNKTGARLMAMLGLNQENGIIH